MTFARRRRPARERGAVSLVALTGVLVLSLTALAAADLGSMLLARSRAQAAADAAALAAIVAQAPVLSDGADPPSEAAAVAEANGARMVWCSCSTASTEAVVEVETQPRITFVAAWRSRPVRATARATMDPDLLSYRS